MDVTLRARHDFLIAEFVCSATELRIVRTPAGSRYTRDIEAFCNEPRAKRFGDLLSDYHACCSSCDFLAPRVAVVEEAFIAGDLLLEQEDLPA
jgi:hypothetical protein